MRKLAWTLLAAVFLASRAAAGVGFETVSIPVAGDRPLTAAVWYPSDAAERPTPFGPYLQSVAPGAAPAAGRHPLVAISHGTGGSDADHLDTAHALAEAGFVVIAVDHTGDTHDNRSRALRITERPGQLIRAIDYATAEWRGAAGVDASRVGAFGFSSGGFTVLAAVGGEPDLSRVARHCAEHPHFFDCQLARATGAAAPAAPFPPAHDRRIRAAVVAAPALGFAFAPSGLSGVKVPVQLWRAEWDTVLPQPYYAEAVHALLPRAEYHVVPQAEHFDFMAPCSAILVEAAPMICPATIDRAAFHPQFNAEVVRFFRANLR